MKPLHRVDIASGQPSALKVAAILAAAPSEVCFHSRLGLRQPVGIYNVSVKRICEKVALFCTALEAYFKAAYRYDDARLRGDLCDKVVHEAESAIYAAAEHIDDVDSIARGFFADDREWKRHSAYKVLAELIKHEKRMIAVAANQIKHQQSRMRVYTIGLQHAGHEFCLHGYYLEGVEGDAIVPNTALHRDFEVFSFSSLAWEIITFLLACSDALGEFLKAMGIAVGTESQINQSAFEKAVIAASRLPLYSFGEPHPFSRMTIQVGASDWNLEPFKSGIYGSLLNGWGPDNQIVVLNFGSSFVGDGVTKNFRIVGPEAVSLQRWT